MLIQAKTLKTSLETLIEQHGLAEVLDRLADLTHTSSNTHQSQITKLLEKAVELALIQESYDLPHSESIPTPLSLICQDIQTRWIPSPQN